MSEAGGSRLPLAAITFDFWDTLYDGGNLPDRKNLRKQAIVALFDAYGLALSQQEVSRLYVESAREADRWWREEHRGYTTTERMHWLIASAGGRPRANCEHIARACEAVDESLLRYPPPLLPGAADAVRALAARCRLAIVSDTGFASGRAQDTLLERDGLLGCFSATIYSMDIGHAKPRPEPFHAAVAALGVESPAHVIHVGDNERTDVAGALAAGLRAIRLDVVRRGGWSATEDGAGRDTESDAELIARTFEELVAYIEACGLRPDAVGMLPRSS
jgi:HAD superfamily hydrolase (TIGR01549 family)